ncbi:MAG: SNF2 family helicase [Phycisphaerales bacterium]|nr:SNF2 family helicase [Phycisphaerales bacterium]
MERPENQPPLPDDSDTLFPPAPSRPRLVDILSQDVTPQVDAAGRQMIASGDALLVKNARNAVHGFVLDRDHYDTRLEWGQSELSAICSCETRAAGFVCPHIWATVLLAERSGAFRALEEAHTHPIFGRSSGRNEGGGAERSRRSANAWPARPGWKIHLASIAQAAEQRARETAASGTGVAGLPRQVFYVVDAAQTRGFQSRGGSGVVVELQSRYQKKARPRAGAGGGGSWTKGAPFRLDAAEIDTFTGPEDREILSRIVGARDEEVQSIPETPTSTGNVKTCTLWGTVGIELLKRMCGTGRCRIRQADQPEESRGGTSQLLWDDGPAYQFILRIAPHDDGKHYTVTGHLRRGEITFPLSAARLLAEPSATPGQAGLAFIDNRVAQAQLHGGLQWLELFESRGAMHVPKSDVQEFLRQIASLPTIPLFDLPTELQFEQFVGLPRPRLVLKKPARTNYIAKIEDRIIGSVFFDYDAGPIDATATAAGTYDPSIRKMILRDKSAEAKQLAILKAVGFRKATDPDMGREGGGGEVRNELPTRLLPAVVPTLIREGWLVEAEGKLYRAATDFRVAVSSGIDWFDLSGSVQFGDQVVPLPRLLSAARKGEHLIKLSDGTFGVLPEEWLAKYGVIVQSGQVVKEDQSEGGGAIRFSRAQAGMLDVLLESQPLATVDATFQNLRNQLHSFGGVIAQKAPTSFVGTLRTYQEEGLGWFDFLRQFSFGGCLADDMGLGKTIQVLALLDARCGKDDEPPSDDLSRDRKGATGTISPPPPLPQGRSLTIAVQISHRRPSLVVAPRSLVFNWLEEAMRFTPKLRILDHTGPSRARSAEKFTDHDVILTTYGTLRSDILFLKDFQFDYVILDEAQAIKNAQTESAKAVRLLQADHRLALSGTPVQNHLGELWSLFEFLNPGMLGAAAVFDARFQSVRSAKPAVEEEGGGASVAEAIADEPNAAAEPEELQTEMEEEDEETPRQMLSRALRPFILRRTKEQVAQDLPPCTEQTILCELDESQRAMYDELRDHYRQTLLSGPGGKTPTSQANRMQVLEALLRLRQAACHPGLIDKTRVAEPSAKLDMLLAQLDEILDEGHKALVFSQFTSLLAIVRKRLDDRQIRYAYLDGKTRDRKSPVEQFQNDPATKLFLISLKAGGLGLNLTGADYVFLLDPWWNPAVEAQAIDRAHRIGQVRHVFAYRLIAQATVEEKVLQLQQTKRDLADAIISEDNAVLTSLTADDLQILLS